MENKKSNYSSKANESKKKWRNGSKKAQQSTQYSNDKSAAKRFATVKATKEDLIELKAMIEERLEHE